MGGKMCSEIIDILELFIVFLVFFVFQCIKYKFPHFSMHFMGGMSSFGIDSVDFDKECTEHTKKDIYLYKKKQKKILIILGVVELLIIFFLFIIYL